MARHHHSHCPSLKHTQLLASVLLAICWWRGWAGAHAVQCPQGVRVSVVYNALIWPDQDWGRLIRYQLEHLDALGIVDCSTVHVVLSVPAAHGNMSYGQLESLLLDGREMIQGVLQSQHAGQPTGMVLSQVHENSFEYPGLHLLWTLAQEARGEDAESTIYLYFHTKGMVNHGRHAARPAEEASLFESTIVPWQQVLRIFSENATTTRCGSFPAPAGWMWTNFFWARASYIKKLVEPIRTNRRHYYEDWLGRLYDATTDSNEEPGRFAGCESCYSINGECSGYGITYLPDTVRHCSSSADHWESRQD